AARSGLSSLSGTLVGGFPGVLVDAQGNDIFASHNKAPQLPALGAASRAGGLGLLFDLQGNTKYASDTLGMGAAFLDAPSVKQADATVPASCALGVLFDGGGADAYASPARSLGFAEGAGAIGLLVDAGGG